MSIHPSEDLTPHEEKQVTVEPQTPQEEKEWKEIPTKHFKVLNISALPQNYIWTNMTKSHIDFWEGNELTNKYSDKLAYISQIMKMNSNELSKEEHTFLVLLIETIDIYIQFLNYRLIEMMEESKIQRSKGGGLVSWFLKKRKEMEEAAKNRKYFFDTLENEIAIKQCLTPDQHKIIKKCKRPWYRLYHYRTCGDFMKAANGIDIECESKFSEILTLIVDLLKSIKYFVHSTISKNDYYYETSKDLCNIVSELKSNPTELKHATKKIVKFYNDVRDFLPEGTKIGGGTRKEKLQWKYSRKKRIHHNLSTMRRKQQSVRVAFH
jgi:hypothetical protein